MNMIIGMWRYMCTRAKERIRETEKTIVGAKYIIQ